MDELMMSINTFKNPKTHYTFWISKNSLEFRISIIQIEDIYNKNLGYP